MHFALSLYSVDFFLIFNIEKLTAFVCAYIYAIESPIKAYIFLLIQNIRKKIHKKEDLMTHSSLISLITATIDLSLFVVYNYIYTDEQFSLTEVAFS